jgi:hypothetical protein
LLAGLIAALISWKYPFFKVVFITMIFTLAAGAIYGVRYGYQDGKNDTWLKLLFWSNTAAWLIPPIGFFTSAATRNLNLFNRGTDRRLFMRLAAVCFVLSFINAVILAKLLT